MRVGWEKKRAGATKPYSQWGKRCKSWGSRPMTSGIKYLRQKSARVRPQNSWCPSTVLPWHRFEKTEIKRVTLYCNVLWKPENIWNRKKYVWFLKRKGEQLQVAWNYRRPRTSPLWLKRHRKGFTSYRNRGMLNSRLNFYRGAIESILTGKVANWHGSKLGLKPRTSLVPSTGN